MSSHSVIHKIAQSLKFSLTAKLIIALFIITRLFIWVYRPIEFTEIIYSYMPYAHLWAEGTRPYLEQWYEYPPLTIPLFYLPHLIDYVTLNSFLHFSYLQAYRGEILVIDVALFILVWQALIKLKTKSAIKWLALSYYCLTTAKANHFIYDSMDWVFASALTLSVAPPLIFNFVNKKKLKPLLDKLQTWLGYWLAVGLKLLNAPLGLPLLILDRKKKHHWLAMILAGGLVWGLPILLYRSSLAVMFVYHSMRGLQVDSFAAIVVRTINSFTHTESIIEIYKNYEMVGPVTAQALKLMSVIFPLSLIAYVIWISYQAWHLIDDEHKKTSFKISFTFGFIILLMLVSKVLSRPFMLWHIPLLVLLPVKTIKQQLKFLIPSALAVIVTLSPVPDVDMGIFRTALLVGVVRSLCFLWLFIGWFKWHKQSFS